MDCISYKQGYKYQIVESFIVDIPISPKVNIVSPSEYIEFTSEGKLTIKKGYAWDGPSGPTVDTLSFMRGSLVHDALYQLMREGSLNRDEFKEKSDRLLQKMCREDGMNAMWAWFVFIGLKVGGNPACSPSSNQAILKAPKV